MVFAEQALFVNAWSSGVSRRENFHPLTDNSSGRKIFQAVVFVAVLLCLAWFDAGSALADEPQRPNVVLILADDLAWTDYGFMGHEAIQTPHLDALAKESLVFTRGYVPTSLCRTSLMCLISGLYPHQHLVTGNDPPEGTDRNEMLKHIDRVQTIPKLLKEQGYASLQTGKWWEGSYERGGFTHGMTHGDPARGGRHGDEGLKIGRQGLKPVTEFLDNVGDKPFFLWYAPMLPHEPHNPPERLLAKYIDKTPSLHVARYWAMVEWFDETCGELLSELDKRKLADNTLVVYLADNGWIQDADKAAFAPKSKRSRYDGGLRTPVMLRWPGKIEPRRDDQTLISSIDLAPTILAACGARPTDQMQGINLLPAALQQEKIARDTLYGAIFGHDIPDIDHAAAGLQHRWCLEEKWKLMLPQAGDEVELYEVLSDPREERNVASGQPEVVARLTKKLDAWWNGY
jgi:arylsulfatase A-like enzyme